MNRDPLETDYVWPVRVHRTAARSARAYARNHSFDVGQQASVAPSDEQPSAIEYMLGALGADLVVGLSGRAERRGLVVDGIELSLTGELDNVLVHLGVVGEIGHPGLRAVKGKLYVSADADEAMLRGLWEEALARSPLFHTLSRCAEIDIRLVIV